MRRFSLLAATSLIPLVAAPFIAEAASLRLYGLAPFEVATGEVDLEQLEHMNHDPLWSRPYLVDEAGIEDQMDAIVDDLEPDPVRQSFVVDLGLFDVDLGGVEIRFDFGFGFRDGQGPEPRLYAIDPAGLGPEERAFDVVVDSVADLTFRIDIDLWGAAEWLLGDSDPIRLRVPVGVYAESRVTVWPQISAEAPTVAFDRAGPVHLSAPDWIRDVFGRMIEDAATVFVELADAQYAEVLAAEIDALMQPHVEQADQRRDDLLNTRLPGVGLTLRELMATGLLDLDVRTRAQHGDGVVAATARFDVTPGYADFEGTIYLPRTRCATPERGGPGWSVRHNEDVVEGMACSAVIDAEDVILQAWAGNDPAPIAGGDRLPTWVPVGQFTAVGAVRAVGGSWACDYRVERMPTVGIYEIAVRHGSPLAGRMDEHGFRGRYLGRRLAQMDLYDRHLRAIDHEAVDFGGAGPGEGVCGSTANAWVDAADRALEFQREIDPEYCPTCGPQMVFNDRVDSRIHTMRIFQPVRFAHAPLLAQARFIMHRPVSDAATIGRRFGGAYRVDQATLDAMSRRARDRGLGAEFERLIRR